MELSARMTGKEAFQSGSVEKSAAAQEEFRPVGQMNEVCGEKSLAAVPQSAPWRVMKEDEGRRGSEKGAAGKQRPARPRVQPCVALEKKVIRADLERDGSGVVQHGGGEKLRADSPGKRKRLPQLAGDPGHAEMVAGKLRLDHVQRAGKTENQIGDGNAHMVSLAGSVEPQGSADDRHDLAQQGGQPGRRQRPGGTRRGSGGFGMFFRRRERSGPGKCFSGDFRAVLRAGRGHHGRRNIYSLMTS